MVAHIGLTDTHTDISHWTQSCHSCIIPMVLLSERVHMKPPNVNFKLYTPTLYFILHKCKFLNTIEHSDHTRFSVITKGEGVKTVIIRWIELEGPIQFIKI